MDETTEIKNAMKDGVAIVGEDRTLKLLRNKKIKKIFMASNTKQSLKEDLKHYTQLAKVELVELSLTNEELGTLCKKPFSISILGISE
ncbi:MAG TPA: ribosomal L7Ae/L30e/S12e/Gadd45 family protein [Candidatus Nanoarchaeia archaeon]|nr:ribosomal L7Ae/L30e/S12e/Gadd45 family protein [Candidatus Nanoarchaeia archaeon]